MSELQQYCWRLLSQQGRPLTSKECFRKAKRRFERIREFDVSEALGDLQNQGVVRLDPSRKWTVLKSPPPEGTTNRESGGQGVGRSIGLTPRPRIVSPETSDFHPKSRSGRWAQFRRLVDYYLNCIENTEMPSLRSYLEKKDDTWLQVSTRIPWDRLFLGDGVIVPKPSAQQAAFQRNRMQRDQDQSVYLGYPVELIVTRNGNRWLMPMILQPVIADDLDEGLQLSPDGLVSPNQAWLESRFRTYLERDGFLRYLGLDSDDSGEAGGGPLRHNVSHLAAKVGEFLGDSLCEEIEPLALSKTIDWKKAKPGIYNACLMSIGGRHKYTRSLMAELRQIANDLSDEALDMTALAHLFPHDSPPETTVVKDLSVRPAIAPLDRLNEQQEEAVKLGLHSNLSAITGPPGTGKSLVVRNLLVNMAARGRSVLFGSKNHRALDAVEGVLNRVSEHGPIIIRTSHQDFSSRKQLHLVLKDLINRPCTVGSTHLEYEVSELDLLLDRRSELRGDLTTLIEQKRVLEVYRGEIKAKKNSISEQNITEDNLRKLTDIANLLNKQDIAKLKSAFKASGIKKLYWILFRNKLLHRAKEVFHSAKALLADSDTLDQYASLIWDTLLVCIEMRSLEMVCSSKEDLIKHHPDRNFLNESLDSNFNLIQKVLCVIIDRIAQGEITKISGEDRRALSALRASLQNFGAKRLKHTFLKEASLLLKLFPLWATTNQSVRSTIPLVPGCFDLLVIDEASQCDIASSIPLLVRAKRALIVGDPMQLQHVTGLKQTTELRLLVGHGLTEGSIQTFTYRVNSLFDCVRTHVEDKDFIMLKEHFRCHPEIAAFASQSFYNDQLLIRTDTSQHANRVHGKLGIQWDDVVSVLERPGFSRGGLHAPRERELILNELKQLEKLGFRGSIGVVTPFAEQKQRLSDEVYQQLSKEFRDRCELLVDTAHGFQGDERDIIFFSLCCGPEMPETCRNFISSEGNLFNVAVTRARAVLRVVGNSKWAQDCGISFIERCLKYSKRNYSENTLSDETPYQSVWEERFHTALTEAGIEAIPQYPVAGRFLDLAVLSPCKIDVEVDGEAYHRTASGGHKDDDIWRDQQMTTCGWKICRFWVYQLREDMAACVSRVKTLMEE